MLSEPAWVARMTPADVRGLTPLVWAHVSPYGAFDLDMEQRLDLDVLWRRDRTFYQRCILFKVGRGAANWKNGIRTWWRSRPSGKR